jgi:MFS family permease
MSAPDAGARAVPVADSVPISLAITFAIQTMVAFAVYCAPVMAPVVGPALGVSAATVGYYIAASYLGSMLSSAAAGGWIARFGPIRVSQAALALCLLGLLLAATGWPLVVMLGGFIVGLGYGPTTPASSSILVRTPKKYFSLIFSIKQTGVPAGGALAGLLVPTLILAFGWQWGAVAIGAACLVLAAAISGARRHYDRDLDPRAPVSLRSAFQPLGMVMADSRLRQLCVSGFVYGGVQITLVTYLVTFLVESFGLSLVLAGLVMAVAQVASVTGRIVWGILADRAVKRRTMLGLLGLGMGASALLALTAGPHWPLWLLFVYASAFGATAVGWNGVYIAEVARRAPEGKASAATGGALFFTFLGVVITPPLFNLVLAVAGSYSVAYSVFAAPALAVGVWMLVRIPER